jgi:cobalt-zinc-cadmium efflux system protein
MKPHNNPGIEKRFLLSLSITLLTLVAEVVGGLLTGSLALLSDAGHVLMDVVALGLSFLALRISARPADDRHTFGYHRMEVFSALLNGISLAGIALVIWWEAYERWQNPQPIRGLEMLGIAFIGLVANLVVAFVLGGHDHDSEHVHMEKDLNLSSAFLHVVGDAISSVGVIIAAVIVWQTGWLWMDPLVSVLIGALILVSSYRVLRQSLHILAEGTPEGLSSLVVCEAIGRLDAVNEIHDLHIWNICSGTVALSAHLVLCEESRSKEDSILQEVKDLLCNQFNIEHTTIQFEAQPCGQGKEFYNQNHLHVA